MNSTDVLLIPSSSIISDSPSGRSLGMTQTVEKLPNSVDSTFKVTISTPSELNIFKFTVPPDDPVPLIDISSLGVKLVFSNITKNSLLSSFTSISIESKLLPLFTSIFQNPISASIGILKLSTMNVPDWSENVSIFLMKSVS